MVAFRWMLRMGTVVSVLALVGCMLACGSRMGREKALPKSGKTFEKKTVQKTEKTRVKTVPDERKQ